MRKHVGTIASALYAAFMLWLYGGDVVRWARLQSSAVTVMNDAPSLPLGIVGVVVALAFIVVLVRKQLLPAPIAKWVPVLAVLVLFFDLIVVSSRRNVIYAEEMLVGAASTIAQVANEASGAEVVARDPLLFEEAVAPYTDVPLFVKGERVPKWKVQLREGCSGPAADVRDATPGTIVYCVSSDRRQAWVNVVATADGSTFGDVAMVGVSDRWVSHVRVSEPRRAPPPQEPVWEAPTPE